MRKFEDMEYIVPKMSYKEAREYVKQCKAHPNSTCCVFIAGHRAKTKSDYEELYREHILRGGWLFNKKDFPWIVAWKYGCGSLWRDNT